MDASRDTELKRIGCGETVSRPIFAFPLAIFD